VPGFLALARILPRWPVFPVGSLLGKIPTSHLGKNPAKTSVLTRIPPRKKICSRILPRILPGSKILEKTSCIEIPAEKLHVLMAETQIPVRVP